LGLENIPSDWMKVVRAGQYALTQKRPKIQKAVRASLKPNDAGVYVPNAEHQNIYDLAQAVIKDMQCKVSVQLCAHIALMRNIYLKHSGNNFWDKLDNRLSQIHHTVKGDKKIVRYILSIDLESR
ncbi:hypothetical protein B0H19DRAFT_958545, partial [Mycena capillaripes]